MAFDGYNPMTRLISRGKIKNAEKRSASSSRLRKSEFRLARENSRIVIDVIIISIISRGAFDEIAQLIKRRAGILRDKRAANGIPTLRWNFLRELRDLKILIQNSCKCFVI